MMMMMMMISPSPNQAQNLSWVWIEVFGLNVKMPLKSTYISGKICGESEAINKKKPACKNQ